MKPISPASYQQMFQITASAASTLSAHRAIMVSTFNAANSIGLIFWDGTGVTLGNLAGSGNSVILPIIAKQVISTAGLTAYGML